MHHHNSLVNDDVTYRKKHQASKMVNRTARRTARRTTVTIGAFKVCYVQPRLQFSPALRE